MNNALIGYTGFVGSNLALQHDFKYLYNSKNYKGMAGKHYDELVCAGVSAIKWQANKEPEKDRAQIRELESVLATVQARTFVLISTIDVYPVLAGANESYDCHLVENHAYGTHRLEFEDFCKNTFDNAFIIRLPGLFGRNIRKNVIYDLLNDNCLEMINVESSFQYYDLENLWSDIQRSIKNDLKVVNFFTEPIKTGQIIDRFFPGKKVGQESVSECHYDLNTKYADLWGKTGNYIYTKDEVLQQLAKFVEDHTEKKESA